MPAQRAISARASSDSPVGRRHDSIHHRQAGADAHRRGTARVGDSHRRQCASMGWHRIPLHRPDTPVLQASQSSRASVTRPRPTTIVDSPRLSRKLGVDLVLASETLQYTGSFKFRVAYNVASNVKQAHIITASSGNFGPAIGFAGSVFKKRCTVVMPSAAPKIKVDAVREYGAEVDLVEVKKKGRLERLGELASQFAEA